MAKVKLLNLQFPRNYRTITEKTIFLSVVLAISSLIFFITFLSTHVFNEFRKFEKISQERSTLSSELNSWSSILDRFPGYSDASFNIALTYFQLNDLAKAREYLNKTLTFDPNYFGAVELDNELKKRGF